MVATIADNVSAVFGSDGGKPLACSLVDRFRLAYAEYIHSHRVEEFYVPAQHDSGAAHDVAKWQELCDTLAKEALVESQSWGVPYLDVVVDLAFIFREGRLVVDVNKSLDKAVTRFQGFQLPDAMLRAGKKQFCPEG